MAPTEEFEIVCPVCKARKRIALPENILNHKNFKFVKIQVSQRICNHTFIVIFDTAKRKIVGSQQIDITLKVSSEEFKSLKKSFSLRRLIYFFGIYGAMCLFHAKIFNYNVKIFSNRFPDEYIDLISDYFNEKIKINNETVISKLDDFYFIKPYILTNLFKDTLILDADKNILNTPWENALDFESELIKNALSIEDQEKRINIISDEIELLFAELNLIINSLKKNSGITKENLYEYIQENFSRSIINQYGISLLEEYLRRNNLKNLLS